MIQDFIKKVGEFHDAFGVERGNVDAELRYELFKEEFEEYLEGYNAYLQKLEYFTTKKGEYVHAFTYMVDAICDMLYITCGTIDLHEWKDTYKLPYFKFTAKSDLDILKVVEEKINNYKTKQNQSEFISMVHCILDLSNYNNIYDILPQLFEEVNLSNMSKLDENGKPIINDGILDPSKPIGKILKGNNYFEPRLKEILENGN